MDEQYEMVSDIHILVKNGPHYPIYKFFVRIDIKDFFTFRYWWKGQLFRDIDFLMNVDYHWNKKPFSTKINIRPTKNENWMVIQLFVPTLWTVISTEITCTLTCEAVDSINTGTSVLTWRVQAIVNICVKCKLFHSELGTHTINFYKLLLHFNPNSTVVQHSLRPSYFSHV